MKTFVSSTQAGCKSSVLLVGKILKYLSLNNHTHVENVSEAEVIIVATCGFDILRENQSIEYFESLLKKSRESVKIYSVGCLNEINSKRLRALGERIVLLDNIENLNSVFPENRPGQTVELVPDQFDFNEISKQKNRNGFQFNLIYKIIAMALLHLEKFFGYPYARHVHLDKIHDEVFYKKKMYIEINQGCAWNCHYCIIKKARGKPISRSINSIIENIKINEAQFDILYLVSDDCASYGADIGTNLNELLMAIFKSFPHKEIEIGYLNPGFIQKNPELFLDLFKKGNIGAINIPIQSGSDKVIKDMNRHYSITTTLDTISKLRLISPNTFIWTHFMTGYPSETWSDFMKTLQASKRFDIGYVFAFSPREGTQIFNQAKNKPQYAKIKRFILHKYILFYILKKIFLNKGRSTFY